MISLETVWRASLARCVLVGTAVGLVSCSSGGGGGGAPQPTSAADLVAARGTPTAFNVECGRHAYDGASQTWTPISGFVRVDTWLYANGTRSDLYVLVNGEIIEASNVDADLTGYANPGFNPRLVGCGEAESTIAGLVGPPAMTTDDSATANQLTFGSVHVKANYHARGPQGAIVVTYVNGKLIGMVTL